MKTESKPTPNSKHRGRGPKPPLVLLLALFFIPVWEFLPAAALALNWQQGARPAPQPCLPWISISGTKLADVQGHVLQLRGFNDDALLESSKQSAPLQESDAALMQAAGMNVVRLPISWARLEPRRGHWDSTYVAAIANAVSMLNQHCLYVVLDMHFLDFSASYGGSGAPAWAQLPLPDWQFGLGDWGRHLSPAQNAAYTYFWIAPDWQQDFMQAWSLIAARFRNQSGVVGYDLFNEPHAMPIPPPRFERDYLWPLYERCAVGINAVDRNHILILEGQLLGDLPTSLVKIGGLPFIYSTHEYSGSLVPPAWSGNAQMLQQHVHSVAAEADNLGVPLWIGEWGIDRAQAGYSGWIDAAIDAYQQDASGWAWWEWRQDSGWGIRSRDGGLRTAELAQLARPYLQFADSRFTVTSAGSKTLQILIAGGRATATAIVGWSSLTLTAPKIQGACRMTSSYSAPDGRLTIDVLDKSACSLTVSASLS